MKKITLNLFGFFFLATIAMFSFSSCSDDDACADTTCLNNGIPTDNGTTCVCVCPDGFEGTDCGTLSRAKFTGNFTVVDNCTSGQNTYQATIAAATTDSVTVLISNFWDQFLNPVRATVIGNNITIATQQPDNDGFSVSGSGTISGNLITLSYTVVEVSTTATDVCNNTTYTKN